MSATGDFLRELGVHPVRLLAAFSGAAMSIFLERRPTPFQAVGQLVAGVVTANYLADGFVDLLARLGFAVGEAGASFVIGLGGFYVARGIFEALKRHFGRPGGPKIPWPPADLPPGPPPPPWPGDGLGEAPEDRRD